MRKLLRSKAVVSTLAVIALFAIGSNFVKLPPRRPVIAAARANVSLPPPSAPIALQVTPRPSVGKALVSWRDLFPARSLRDPFVFTIAPGLHSGIAHGTNKPHFALQAISIEPGRALAIIDRRIVAAGEAMGDYHVERILSQEVWLEGPGGRLILTLHPAPLRDKSP